MITSIAVPGVICVPRQHTRRRTVLTRSDALSVPEADAGTAAGKRGREFRFRPSRRSRLGTEGRLGQGPSRAARPDGEDLVDEQAANAAAATDVPDNAPQNTYATVKVNGKVVATLYNGGSR